jgi:hypothetical protein
MVVDLLGGKKYVTFLRSWEGGTSSRQSDYAKKCHTGIHTVKGITWCTFEGLAPNLTYQDFLNMSDTLWNELYMKYYTRSGWPVEPLKELVQKYPLIAYNILESCWMRGPSNAESDWAKFLRKHRGYGPDNITPAMIVNSFLNETRSYNAACRMMYYSRERVYRDIGGKNVNGWMNRLNNLYYYFAPKVVKDYLGISKNTRLINGL